MRIDGIEIMALAYSCTSRVGVPFLQCFALSRRSCDQLLHHDIMLIAVVESAFSPGIADAVGVLHLHSQVFVPYLQPCAPAHVNAHAGHNCSACRSLECCESLLITTVCRSIAGESLYKNAA